MLGLRWDDLDLATDTLAVRRSLQRTKAAGLIFEEPKTRQARRTVKLSRTLVAALRAHHKRQLETRMLAGSRWREHDLLFTTTIGTPLDPKTLGDDFARMLTKAELPHIRFHDLRHSAATLALTQGIHPKVVAEMLGHSKISLTLDVYSHALPNLQAEAAEKMASILAQEPTGT